MQCLELCELPIMAVIGVWRLKHAHDQIVTFLITSICTRRVRVQKASKMARLNVTGGPSSVEFS